MAQDFENKVAVVTGGTSGIGRAVVLELAKRGCQVWFCGRSGDLEHVEENCNGNGHYVQCDISTPEGVKMFIGNVQEACGRIDYLVNNVAYDGRVTFDDADDEQFSQFIKLNLQPAFSVTRAALTALRAGEGRSIVNLGTTNWMLGLSPFTLYSASKSGLLGYTRALARELGPERIRVNMISPGWVMTKKQLELYVTEQDKADLLRDQALPALLEEEDIVQPILFMLSSAAKAITGQNLIVDCGKLMQ